ncbi:MAG: OsmC family protein [Actinomycetota bacterium]
METDVVVVADAGQGRLAQRITAGSHAWLADEPAEAGGDDLGPTPHQLLLAGLGACTAMTLRMYAGRKGWPLARVEVRLSRRKDGDGEVFERELILEGPLDDDQRARLKAIAERCPVHRTLTGKITIETRVEGRFERSPSTR